MEKKHQILEKIKSSQQPDGSFLIFTNCAESGLNSPYATALVLSFLCEVESFESLEMVKKKAFYYLLSEGGNLKFSYVSKKFSVNYPVDEELSATFLALSSLVKYDHEIFDGKALVGILKLLTDCEVEEGGPYFSRPDGSGKKSIGLMENIQICNFLSLCEVDLEKLDQFVEEGVEAILLKSMPSILDLYTIYFFSKKAREGLRDRIVAYLERQLEGQDNNRIFVLIASNSLVNLGKKIEDLEEVYGMLAELENSESESYFSFASVVSGGVLVDLFLDSYLITSLFELVLEEKRSRALKAIKNDQIGKDSLVYDLVTNEVRSRFEQVGVDLQKYCANTLERVIGFDHDRQIGLLAYKFKEALGEGGKMIPEATIISLGAANFYLWMAYTIYDDFFDGEGDPRLLPAANFCQREFASVYGDLMVGNEDFKTIFNQIMDNLDLANSWEVSETRTLVSENIFHIPQKIPDYKNFSILAERSLAHCFGPVAILMKLGFSRNSKEVINLVDFFKHYLISRQLNDDSHDWEEDFKRGHVSSIVSAILEKLCDSRAVPGLTGSKVDLENDFSVLQKYFWMEMLPGICQTVLQNISKSKDSLKNISVIKRPELMEKFLCLTENAALNAIKEHKQAVEFLEAY